MWIRIADVELSDNVCCDAVVEFECVSRGCPGDYWTPPEGPEFEITECYVEEAWGSDWSKGRTELGDWAAILDQRLGEIVDDLPDLYELQHDEYTYGHIE